jgi:hypothetical protein
MRHHMSSLSSTDYFLERSYMRPIFIILLITVFFFSASARENSSLEIAKDTLKAHGGEKLLKMRTMVLKGAGTVTAPGSNQIIPITFVIVLSNDKYRFDLDGGLVFNFKQIFDGEEAFTSMDGVNVAPINLTGLPLLTKIEESGFVVSELPDKLKNQKKGFRVTSPQGYYTDFIIDEKTSLVKEYGGKYEVNGRPGSTSVEIQKYREVEGVMLPEKYLQRIESGQFSSYGDFKAKEILVNIPVDAGLFAKP